VREIGTPLTDVTTLAPTPTIARDAARYPNLGVSLADGFAIATAGAHRATLASFDHRVRRALPHAGVASAVLD